MEFSSKLIAQAVKEIAKLPGIGQRSALRLALHLLKQPEAYTNTLSQALQDLRQKVRYCQKCHHLADENICEICTSPKRDNSMICVVESSQDVLAIENTNQYRGLYHVLGGVISPMAGIAPQDLQIDSLLARLVDNKEVKEIIFALNPTMDGDTTIFYITKKIQPFNLQTSAIARGVPVGSELEYADEITLGRSILTRLKM